MICVDSSVWIDALRDGASEAARELVALLDANEVAVAIPVYLELLTGASRRDGARLRRGLSALPVFRPTDLTWSRMERWIDQAGEAGERFGIADLLVAAIAAERELAVWSHDDDFARMAELGFVSLHRPR